MNKVKLDIMVVDRFYCTLNWDYNPLYKFDIKLLEEEFLRRLPTLRGKYITVCFPDDFGVCNR